MTHKSATLTMRQMQQFNEALQNNQSDQSKSLKVGLSKAKASPSTRLVGTDVCEPCDNGAYLSFVMREV